jgi:hypothetical protein
MKDNGKKSEEQERGVLRGEIAVKHSIINGIFDAVKHRYITGVHPKIRKNVIKATDGGNMICRWG